MKIELNHRLLPFAFMLLALAACGKSPRDARPRPRRQSLAVSKPACVC